MIALRQPENTMFVYNAIYLGKENWMNNLKTINFMGTLLTIVGVAVGILQLHWASIFVLAIGLLLVRQAYVKAEQNAQGKAEELNKIQAAMPAVRNFATLISSVIMAAVLYGVGYGVRYLVNMVLKKLKPFIFL